MDFTVLPAQPHVHPQSEWAIPAFAFPAAAGTHLPTPEGWKAEMTVVRSSPSEIRTCNLPIANPALYQTATSTPSPVDSLWNTVEVLIFYEFPLGEKAPAY